MTPTSLQAPGLTCVPEQEPCHGHGVCKLLLGGLAACQCDLGYQGDLCQDTVNRALSAPLTLGVLGIIVALVMLTFCLAKLRQKQKRRRRELVAAKINYNVPV